MRRQFEEKFQQIRVEFDKAFKELFGGGKGTLELDEEEDILKRVSALFPSRRERSRAEYDATLRWGKGSDRHCALVCHSEPEALSILSAG